jgi:hypothetical protein
MSFLHQKPARLLLAASALGLLVIVGAVFATSAHAFSHSFALSLDGYSKDLIPTGNVPCNGSCQRDCNSPRATPHSRRDCVRQARPQAVLRASDPTQPPVLQRFATASSQQNPPAHSSGRIRSASAKVGTSWLMPRLAALYPLRC